MTAHINPAEAARLVEQEPAQAVMRLRDAVAADPRNAGAWRLLARALRNVGQEEDAAEADLNGVRATAFEPEMVAIAAAMLENDLPQAEARLRQRLRAQPTDVAAIRLMAELAARIGRLADAEKLLHRALELAPGFVAARANLAGILNKQHRYAEAIAELDIVAAAGGDLESRNLRAAVLGRTGDYEEAARLYGELTQAFPGHARIWMSYGHVLKTIGRQDDSIAAYRKALECQADLGEVWWSLANLKTVSFDEGDVAAMEAALAGDPPPLEEDRLHLHFALGKAYADHGEIEPSFRHYAQGNAMRSAQLGYDAGVVSAQVDSVIATLTPQFVSERQGWGDPAPDPVFILGLPRAGSTLIEQILASHSQVEGTMELPDIPAMAMREARAMGLRPQDWPDAVAAMDAGKLAALGAEFLDRTRIQRKTDKPFYIDKLPNNWAYAGFIHLILPNARIIDARRHPLDCCFSNFRQHFAKGQGFTYDLADIGRYYADYVRAMDHYDRVLPGRIHRVIHEELLDDPEAVVRAMLAYLGLPFEEACLEFHRNRRAVRTASSEQVRRPINRDGVGQWVPYEKWLGPLLQSLGDLTETYGRKAGRIVTA
ncbi:sulfotransferase [Altererythrobacter sp. CC-YST694]|uniref:tetratricopeptide repeat-containing sulfotransferase family protein n=1 Tax=Altererythrobacter sp. CC-YST694 TaxID=2755038 RepID=UPI001D028AA9|nr:tetratricopeptide repeat-containing sulfotransferase family protein [Altererythrobacter sp. CC-YST694]MCB5423846.1 sulfotransferase [Altererythrobacter sp. CC-YST694]